MVERRGGCAQGWAGGGLMAFIFGDSMDLYASDAAMQAAGWSLNGLSSVTPSTTTGRFGNGGVFVTNSAVNAYIARATTIAASTIIISCAFKHTSLAVASDRLLVAFFNNSGADRVASIYLEPNGAIRLRDANNAIVTTSAAGVVWENVWHYLEFKVLSNNGAGTATVRINENAVITRTGLDTSITETDIDFVTFGGASGNTVSGVYYDDIVILDDSGAAPQNDLIGDVGARGLLPTADTATTDWDRSGGAADYEMIDDPIPGDHDSDSTYLYTTTAGAKSLFDCANLTDTPAYIYAVIVAAAMRKADAGTRTARVYLVSGVTTSTGDTWSIGTDYQTWRHIWALNPSGSAVWDKTAVNALQMGMEVVV